jgi:abortive infection bacteriophage resistance protein
MKYLRSSDEEWAEFVDKLSTLLQNNRSIISLAAMNLPTDWKKHLSV